jgi:hypothetical protein
MKLLLTEFAYNNSVYSTTDISPFFAIYSFYSNVSFSVKDDYPEKEISIAREKVENFKNKDKELVE